MLLHWRLRSKINMWQCVGYETFKIALTTLSGLIPFMQTLWTMEPPRQLGVEILNEQTKTANEFGWIKGWRDVGNIYHLFICKRCRLCSVDMQIMCDLPSLYLNVFFVVFFLHNAMFDLDWQTGSYSHYTTESSCKLGTNREGWIVPCTHPSY